MKAGLPILVSALALSAGCTRDGDRTEGPTGPEQVDYRLGERGAPGAVYLASNDPVGNAIVAFRRGADGHLSARREYPTGGLGTGTGLGNQGGLVLGADHRTLLVVNAGSNDVSLFEVTSRGLELRDREPSGGTMPISITIHRRLVYVLNAGGAGNITGFRLEKGGLVPVAGSTRPLSGSAGQPAQVELSPSGRVLLVTEKASNRITTYTVGEGGLPSGPNPQPSVGATPFGFAFADRTTLVVSEAFGGAPNGSALSSYRVSQSGILQVVSPSIGTTETAACWVVITRNGKFAYTTNTGSGTISGYEVTPDAKLELLDPDGVTAKTDPGPIDLALSRNSRYLYALNGAGQSLSAFRVRSDGALVGIGGVSGLPPGANGLAAQ